MRKIYLDALPERLQEEILQDRAEVRDETIMGLTPARWAQVLPLFSGQPGGQDVIYCFSRGLDTHAAAMYLGVSERTCRNTGARYLDKLRALAGGTGGGAQTQMANDRMQDDDFQFAPAPRAPTRRGRPRKAPEAETVQLEMCF